MKGRSGTSYSLHGVDLLAPRPGPPAPRPLEVEQAADRRRTSGYDYLNSNARSNMCLIFVGVAKHVGGSAHNVDPL